MGAWREGDSEKEQEAAGSRFSQQGRGASLVRVSLTSKRNSLHEPGVRKFLDTLELGFECG